MKTILFVIAIIATMSSPAAAASRNLTAKWDQYTAPQGSTVTGYKLMEKGGVAVASTQTASATSLTFAQDFVANQCRTYNLIAVTSAGDSPPSADATACAIGAPTTLTITIAVQ